MADLRTLMEGLGQDRQNGHGLGLDPLGVVQLARLLPGDITTTNCARMRRRGTHLFRQDSWFVPLATWG
ncbi:MULTISPECIES: hypothetical protein [Streptomyces]|uniref:hypothetical protein n=1 Tax=Streptomyces TaxID=1883 RepID=UPI003321B067